MYQGSQVPFGARCWARRGDRGRVVETPADRLHRARQKVQRKRPDSHRATGPRRDVGRPKSAKRRVFRKITMRAIRPSFDSSTWMPCGTKEPSTIWWYVATAG